MFKRISTALTIMLGGSNASSLDAGARKHAPDYLNPMFHGMTRSTVRHYPLPGGKRTNAAAFQRAAKKRANIRARSKK